MSGVKVYVTKVYENSCCVHFNQLTSLPLHPEKYILVKMVIFGHSPAWTSYGT